MNTLHLTAGLSLAGSGQGTSGNAYQLTGFPLSLLATLSSTDTGGNLANKALFFPSRTLSASGDETFDLTSFTDALGTGAQSMTKVRVWGVAHLSTSLAVTGIRVGNAASPFPGMLNTAATAQNVLVGHSFIYLAPTTTALPVSAGQGIRVVNLDSSFTATYTIFVFGE